MSARNYWSNKVPSKLGSEYPPKMDSPDLQLKPSQELLVHMESLQLIVCLVSQPAVRPEIAFGSVFLVFEVDVPSKSTTTNGFVFSPWRLRFFCS